MSNHGLVAGSSPPGTRFEGSDVLATRPAVQVDYHRARDDVSLRTTVDDGSGRLPGDHKRGLIRIPYKAAGVRRGIKPTSAISRNLSLKTMLAVGGSRSRLLGRILKARPPYSQRRRRCHRKEPTTCSPPPPLSNAPSNKLRKTGGHREPPGRDTATGDDALPQELRLFVKPQQ